MFGLVKNMAAAAKPAARKAPTQTRFMSGHAPAPEAGSLEAKVRAYLPKDYQIVLATLGFYTTIIMLFKLKPSKKQEAIAASGSSSTSSAIPSLFDEEFDSWSQEAGNLERWEKSLDTLEG